MPTKPKKKHTHTTHKNTHKDTHIGKKKKNKVQKLTRRGKNQKSAIEIYSCSIMLKWSMLPQR